MVGLDQCPLLVGRQEEEAWERGGGEGATTVISVFENILIMSIIVTMFHNVMKGYVCVNISHIWLEFNYDLLEICTLRAKYFKVIIMLAPKLTSCIPQV